MTSGVPSALGTRVRSDWAPSTGPPSLHVVWTPKQPPTSHGVYSSSRHAGQTPQLNQNGDSARSPGHSPRTCSRTSSMTQMNPFPTWHPPSTVSVTRTTTPVGAPGHGSAGSSATCTDPAGRPDIGLGG